MIIFIVILFIISIVSMNGQLLGGGQQGQPAQVKISEMPFPVANAQQLNSIVWTMLGTTAKESIYCVSEAPVSQLRFVCVDCLQRNITDMVDVLNSAQDLTRSAGFPTVQLRNIAASVNWTGVSLMCQAALGGRALDSASAIVDVRYLHLPHVVDASGQAPILISNQGYRFYVECMRGPDGLCQASGRRKTLRCAVQAHPPATVFRWLKNGVVTSGNGAEITIGTEMIGQSIQCSANNGLYSDQEMPVSQAVQIDPYSTARLVQDNFQQAQTAAPFQPGGRIEMNQQIALRCLVEGNPRPVVFWKLRRSNGQVVDAACPQGFDGQYQEIIPDGRTVPIAANIVRLNALCTLRIANYSYTGQYWCSACSYVSQGIPECSPTLEAPGTNTLTVQVQGPPMESDAPPTIEQIGDRRTVIVNYCADPMPRPPREVTFEIGTNELQAPGQEKDGYKFESQQQNNTVTNCYMARLTLPPLLNIDNAPRISLKVQNQYGSKTIPVQLENLLGGNGVYSGGLSGWWIALIVLAALGLLIAASVLFCRSRHLFCFDRTKQIKTSTYKADKKTTKIRDLLSSSDGPRGVHFTPSTIATMPAANEAAYEAAVSAAAYLDSRMSSV